MCDIFNFLWDQGVHMFFCKEKQSCSIFFFIKIYFYWVSCFKISFYDDNVNQTSQLSRETYENVIKQSIYQIMVILLLKNFKGVLLRLTTL